MWSACRVVGLPECIEASVRGLCEFLLALSVFNRVNLAYFDEVLGIHLLILIGQAEISLHLLTLLSQLFQVIL